MNRTINAVFMLVLIFFCVQSIVLSQVDENPIWYKALPEFFKPIETGRIKSLEKIRIKNRGSHEDLIYSILSTPWAVEKAQDESLKQAKRAYPNLREKDLWRVVLLSRFQTLRNTVGLESHESSPFSPEKLKMKIENMYNKIDLILIYLDSFSDVVRFALCIEEELGNFIDPTGIINQITLILGTKKPKEEDMKWFTSIQEKIL